MRARAELSEDASRKRPADQAAISADPKRQKIEGGVPQFEIPPLGPGPHSLAGVFTLTNNLGLQGFDVTQLPANLAAKISVMTLAGVDQQVLDFTVNVSARVRVSQHSETVLTWSGNPGSFSRSAHCRSTRRRKRTADSA
jgi:hypothetical protein